MLRHCTTSTPAMPCWLAVQHRRRTGGGAAARLGPQALRATAPSTAGVCVSSGRRERLGSRLRRRRHAHDDVGQEPRNPWLRQDLTRYVVLGVWEPQAPLITTSRIEDLRPYRAAAGFTLAEPCSEAHHRRWCASYVDKPSKRTLALSWVYRVIEVNGLNRAPPAKQQPASAAVRLLARMAQPAEGWVALSGRQWLRP